MKSFVDLTVSHSKKGEILVELLVYYKRKGEVNTNMTVSYTADLLVLDLSIVAMNRID